MIISKKIQLLLLLILAVTIVCIVYLLVWFRLHKTQKLNGFTHAEISGTPIVKVKAEELKSTYITPHLECEIKPNQNVLWCATFQIAWSEYYKLSGDDIRSENAPEIVRILNKKTVTREDLDENSYVAMAGWRTSGPDDIVSRIKNALNETFKGQASPELLQVLESVPPGILVAYTYLFKDLPFEWAFDRMHHPFKFAGCEVESFGIVQFTRDQQNEVKAANQILIYDYKNEDDFIIELKTQSKSDRLILAKIKPAQTLAETIIAVQNRVSANQPTSLYELSSLFIPVLDFDVLRDYHELINEGLAIAKQQIRFRLDERGAVLKSEALMATARGQDLIFDKPFLVMIQRENAKVPYFALWNANAELLVPFSQKE
jgi:hypothetical protein